MGITTDRNDPRLTRGVDTEQVPQAEVYLVLSEGELAKGFVRPFRDAYRHDKCLSVTTMGKSIAETYARDPIFYGATYCIECKQHSSVSEFHWYEMNGEIGPVVGS